MALRPSYATLRRGGCTRIFGEQASVPPHRLHRRRGWYRGPYRLRQRVHVHVGLMLASFEYGDRYLLLMTLVRAELQTSMCLSTSEKRLIANRRISCSKFGRNIA